MKDFFARYRVVVVCVALIVATVGVFARVKNCDFINFDDNVYVTENADIKAGFTIQSIRWAITSDLARNWHPLTLLSLMLDYRLFGQNAAAFHLTSLFWHTASAIVLFLVLNSMTSRFWPSIFVAAAFALHPLHVESVAWVSERKDVLSAFFWFLTMGAYERYARRPGIKRYLPVAAAFILGLLSKAMLVTMPFVLLLLDYWPLGRIGTKVQKQARANLSAGKYVRAPLGALIKEKIPLFVVAAIFCVVTFLIQRQGGTMRSFDMIPLHLRFANALVSYIAYIWKMLLPVSLSVLYPHPEANLPIWQPIVAAVVLFAATAFVFARAKSRPYLLVGWLFYLGTLVPVIGIVQVGAQAMADRYSYIPLTGIFIIIAWGLPDILARFERRNIVMGIAVAVILAAWLTITFVQIGYWKNSLTLFQHALDTTRNNYSAHNNLAIALTEAGQVEEAIEHYKKAMEIEPGHVKSRFNLGNAYLRLKRYADAIDQWQQLSVIDPQNATVYHNIGYALTLLGRFDEAAAYYEKALQIDPNAQITRENLAIVRELKQKSEQTEALCKQAYSLAAEGKYDEAIGCYEKVLQINAALPDAHNNLGNIYFIQGRYDEAMEHYAAALKNDPNFADPHYNLGMLLEKQGKAEDAAAEYREALRLNPGHAKAAEALKKLLDSLPSSK